MNKLKYLIYYFKYKKEINQHYNYALKNGYAQNEYANWFERTTYWLRSEYDN